MNLKVAIFHQIIFHPIYFTFWTFITLLQFLLVGWIWIWSTDESSQCYLRSLDNNLESIRQGNIQDLESLCYNLVCHFLSIWHQISVGVEDTDFSWICKLLDIIIRRSWEVLASNVSQYPPQPTTHCQNLC